MPINEPRQQAYLNLIQRLLNCGSDEEAEEILVANQDLIDAGLVQTVEAVAEYVSQQGDENTANWLINLATQLARYLYTPFLGEVLQATAESGGDAQVVDPLLAANTDKLNLIFADVLRGWATTTLEEMQPNQAQFLAALIGNFSNRIQQFPLGDKASNMEIAITGYEIALTVYTRSALPQDWAMTQNNLGLAYYDRILGDRAENIESAIAAYTAALSVRTRTALPQQWATTQNNLGIAYRNRILGDRAENIENAVAAYTAALEVCTRSALPYEWARTQNNLGLAYYDRILGDRAENIERAIAAYTAALEVRTRSALPLDWAMTQNNLGLAYGDRILGDRAENIETAITAYTAALEVHTRSAFPQDWARTQHNLGLAYYDRILGDRAENIETAIKAYTAALSVYTREALPQNHAKTLWGLGIAYQKAKEFNSAYKTFESAIETVESLRGEIVSGEESKRKQAEYFNQVYNRMVEVCLELQEESQAIEYIERSKTRNLVELLAIKDLYPTGEISEDVRNELRQLRQKIYIEKQRLAAEATPDYTHINQLRQRYNELYPYKPIQFQQIQNLLDDDAVIIEWYIFNDCFRAFIITRDKNKPEIWHSNAEDLKNLKKWTNNYLKQYSQKKPHWRNQLHHQLTQLAEILHINDIVSLVPTQCKKVILVPHLYLHLLPLHALQLSSGEYLIDKFPHGVSYAPSCQLLHFAQTKATPPPTPPRKRGGVAKPGWGSDFRHLFAIQNPTDDLEFTDIEVETIAAAFTPHHILKKSAATEAALKQQPNADNFRDAHWLHFSCHGYFNFKSPLQSGLQLADTLISPIPADATRLLKLSDDVALDLEKCLTLEDIFNLSFPHCRLVTLSACESGLVDIRNTSDEYIGLPSGFLRAGTANIVSSLWAVDDFSTAILMIKFYENLQTLTRNVPVALNEAQKWFRQVNQRELLLWIDGNKNMNAQHKQKIKQRLEQNYLPEHKPFQQAWFWAAFCAIGE